MNQRTLSATMKTGRPCSAPSITADGLYVALALEHRDRLMLGQSCGGSARSNANCAAKALSDDSKNVIEVAADDARRA
jgi:hypothetical protein